MRSHGEWSNHVTAITYRKATADDLDTLAQLRYEMELERQGAAGIVDHATFLAAHGEVMREWLLRGGLHAWLAEAEGVPVASAVILSWRMPPNAQHLIRRRGLVTNVYTLPAYRGQGIARRLMELLIADARESGIARLVLSASTMGRPLYEDLGFGSERVMDLDL